MIVHVSQAVHVGLPHRCRVEFAPIEPLRLSRFARIAWRIVAAVAIAAITAWTVATTISDAAPVPDRTATPLVFQAVITPSDARAWMRSSLGIQQPRFIGDAR